MKRTSKHKMFKYGRNRSNKNGTNEKNSDDIVVMNQMMMVVHLEYDHYLAVQLTVTHQVIYLQSKHHIATTVQLLVV